MNPVARVIAGPWFTNSTPSTFDPATIVTVPRTMTNYVVTEYGAVDIKARTTWERAELLIIPINETT